MLVVGYCSVEHNSISTSSWGPNLSSGHSSALYLTTPISFCSITFDAAQHYCSCLHPSPSPIGRIKYIEDTHNHSHMNFTPNRNTLHTRPTSSVRLVPFGHRTDFQMRSAETNRVRADKNKSRRKQLLIYTTRTYDS